MSWKSEGLPIVGWGDGGAWSVADAEWLLDVPARKVREALRAGGIEAMGLRFDRGRGTRHVRVYRAEDVLRVLSMADEEGAEKKLQSPHLRLRGYFWFWVVKSWLWR
jgi:hypothetical protein